MAGAVRKAAAPLEGVELAAEDGPLILREVRNAVRRLMRDLDAIMAEHRELWLARNRAGGLAQMSMPPFERLQAGYQEMLRFSSDT